MVRALGLEAAVTSSPGRAASVLLYACFFLSGAASLVYEVVWMRQLALTLGSTTPAVSTVLATFMLGLALGAWAFGRVADRARDPLRLYAYLEAGVGLYALLVPRLVETTRGWHVAAAQGLEGHGAALLALRLVSAAALLLLPTVLMGGTLPILVRFAGRSRSLGRELGLLYGVNVAGAVVGCLLAGFVLIRAFGVTGAGTVAAVLNLSIAVAVLLAGKERTAPLPSVGGHDPGEGPVPSIAGGRGLLWAVVFLSGFVTLGCEVLWTRMLVFSFHSTVYAFTMILSTFLAGLALGSWAFASWIAGKRESFATLAGVQIAAGLVAVALVPWAARVSDSIPVLSRSFGYSGASYMLVTALAAAALMLLPTVLMGVVFPMATRLLADDPGRVGRRIGGAYLLNTVGSALGAVMVPFLFVPQLTLKGAFLLLCGLQIAVGGLLLVQAPLSRRGRVASMSSAAVLLGLGAWLVSAELAGPNPFDPPRGIGAREKWEVLAHRDGTTASVSVVQYRDGVRGLRIDGFEAAAEDSDVYAYMRLMSHLPLLLHPDPHRLLVISFGTGATAGTGLLHPGVRIDMVDINPAVFGFGHYFSRANGDVLRSPRARAIVDDGRNYVLVSREKYDVITSEPMPPTYAGIVNLYSREYYQLARERLNPGGFVVQWLPFSLLDEGQTLAILRTVQSVFPETTLWIQGRSGIIVARRDQPSEIDVAALRRRLEDPVLREGLGRIGVRSLGDVVAFYGLGPATVARITASAGLVTDEHPSLEFPRVRHLMYTVRRFYRDEELRSLVLVNGLRLEEPLPLVNVSEADAQALRDDHQVAARLDLAGIWWAEGEAARARAILDEGLGVVQGTAGRARLLSQEARWAELAAAR